VPLDGAYKRFAGTDTGKRAAMMLSSIIRTFLPLLAAWLLGAVWVYGHKSLPFPNKDRLTQSIRFRFLIRYFAGLTLLTGLSFLICTLLPPPPVPQIIAAWIYVMPVDLALHYFLPPFVFSSAVLAALITEKGIPALIFTPLTAGVLLLAILPLIVQFYSCSYMYMLLLLSFIALLPLGLCLIVQHYSLSSGGRSSGDTLALSILVVMLVSHGIHVVLVCQSGHNLKVSLARAEASGLVSAFNALVKFSVPGQANAADYYKEAFKLKEEMDRSKAYDYYTNSLNFPDGLTLQQRASGIKAMTADLQHDRLYQLISRATTLRYCCFGREYTRDILFPNSYYAKVGKISNFMVMRTYFLAEAGRYDDAWKNARTGLLVSSCFQERPRLYTGIACIAGDKAALRSFHIMIEGGYGDTANYDGLRHELDLKKSRSLSALKLSMNGELLQILSELERFHAMVPSGYITYLMRPAFNRDKAQAVDMVTRLIKLIEVPYYKAKTEILNLHSQALASITAGTYFYSLYKCILMNTVNLTDLEGLQVALALKAFKADNGRYPYSLKSLPTFPARLPVDPFTGKSFIYRKSGGGFILYSCGLNGNDDSGKYEPEHGFDDIAWKCPR
jgi:hypothetical protein